MSSQSLPGPHNITRVTLDNDITLLIYENFSTQSVVITGSLRASASHEMPSITGLAALTTSALMRGTAQRDFMAIADSLESIGADLSLSTGMHRTSFFGKALAEDLPVLIDLLADVTRHPTFPEIQIERLRGEIITGLKIRMQDTRYRANRLFHETLYPADHPYHYSIRGTIESVSALTVDELRAFHARTFGPAGMVIVIVGAVTADRAIDTVRAHFADWHNPDQAPAAPIPDAPEVLTGQRTFTPVPGKTQSDLVIGLPGPSRLSPDYDAASIANSVLGQFGMMGRVGATVREELGLAYYVYSSMDAGIGRGAWSVTAGVNPKNVDLAAERIRDEIRRLTTEPISAQELADNQSYFVGRLPLQLESNEGLAGAILNMELYNLGLDYLLNYRDRIQAVTTEAVLAAARRYLDADRLVMAVAGPAD
ncbi:MAG: M16 family metallopeptidase [Candidatus Flexifilum sp.]